MTPKKIYLNYVDESDPDKTWSEEPVSVCDCKMKNREYTDLSQVWHDASEKPILHKPILIQCGYPLHIYEATALSEDVIWGDFVVLNAIFRWAYIKDLLPKGGEK